MVWFFKSRISKREFHELIESIKTSFSNVKNDISKIKDRTSDTEQEIHNIIGYLDQSLKILSNKIDSSKETLRQHSSKRLVSDRLQINRDAIGIEKEELVPTKVAKQNTQSQTLNKITSVQEEMLKRLAALNRENPNSQVSAKDLASEMYPETNYTAVRPMISNYLDILEELNLLKKIRKRRQVYIELTEKGYSLLEYVPLTKVNFSRVDKKTKRKKI